MVQGVQSFSSALPRPTVARMSPVEGTRVSILKLTS